MLDPRQRLLQHSFRLDGEVDDFSTVHKHKKDGYYYLPDNDTGLLMVVIQPFWTCVCPACTLFQLGSKTKCSMYPLNCSNEGNNGFVGMNHTEQHPDKDLRLPVLLKSNEIETMIQMHT